MQSFTGLVLLKWPGAYSQPCQTSKMELLSHIFANVSSCSAWKVSVFGVILVRIFPHSDRMRKIRTSGLNSERYSTYLRIQSECGKIRTRITPNRDTFYAVLDFWQGSEYAFEWLWRIQANTQTQINVHRNVQFESLKYVQLTCVHL